MSPFGLFAPKTGHEALFNSICQFHNIDRKTKTILDQVIKQYNINPPADLFINPRWIRQAISAPEFGNSETELRQIYSKWFEG